MGEEFACDYNHKFNNVKWVNKDFECHNPFDLTGFNKEWNYKVFIEVKSTIWKTKNWFNLSKGEYGWAKKRGHKYIIAHIYVDLKTEKAEFITEFVNPAHHDELHLSMRYTK